MRPRPAHRRALAAAAASWAVVACGSLQTAGPAGTGTVVESTASSTMPPASSAGTTTPTTAPDAAGQLAALEAAERQWSSMGIADYRFTLVNNCFCVPAFVGPILVVVSGGAVESLTLGPDVGDPAWAGSTVPAETVEQIAGTAEALFAIIRERIGQKDFSAEYDEATGFPLGFYSDPIPEAADDEYGFRTAAFEAT
ncbi:MAG: DUF6174 domain-containing protein [Ilumatobacteraceae bacterium]